MRTALLVLALSLLVGCGQRLATHAPPWSFSWATPSGGVPATTTPQAALAAGGRALSRSDGKAYPLNGVLWLAVAPSAALALARVAPDDVRSTDYATVYAVILSVASGEWTADATGILVTSACSSAMPPSGIDTPVVGDGCGLSTVGRRDPVPRLEMWTTRAGASMVLARFDASAVPTSTDVPVMVGGQAGWLGQGIGYNSVTVPLDTGPAGAEQANAFFVLAGTASADIVLHLAAQLVADPAAQP